MILVKGNFVSAAEHPEYGVGRVIAVDVYVTRVLFPVGGLRVYREADVDRLTNVAAPSAGDLAVLDLKEGNLSRGIADHLAPASTRSSASTARASRRRPR